MQGSKPYGIGKNQEQKQILKEITADLIKDLEAANSRYAAYFKALFEDPSISQEQFLGELLGKDDWLYKLYEHKQYNLAQAEVILVNAGRSYDSLRIMNSGPFPGYARNIERSHYWQNLLQKLLDSGVDLSQIKTETGNTLLHTLCRSPVFRLDLALRLIREGGVNVNAANNRGKTPPDLLKENIAYVWLSPRIEQAHELIEGCIEQMRRAHTVVSAPFFLHSQNDNGALRAQEQELELGAE